MYVCMSVCLYVCMYVCIYLSINESINQPIKQASKQSSKQSINQSYLYMIYIYISICLYLCIYIYIHTHVSIFVSRNAVLSRSNPTSKRFQTHPNCGRASWHHVLSTRMEDETHTHTHTFCAGSFKRPLALGLSISKGFLTKIMNYNDYFIIIFSLLFISINVGLVCELGLQ